MVIRHSICYVFQYVILFAVLMLLGCSQDDSTTKGVSDAATSGIPIYFLAATNDAFSTRGVAMAGDLDTEAQFRVYATKQLRNGNAPAPAPSGALQAFIPDGGYDNTVSYQSVNIYENDPGITPYYVNVWKFPHANYLWPDDVYMVNFYAIHPATAPAISDILTSKSIVYDGSTEALSLKGQYDLMTASVRTHRDDGSFTQELNLFADNRAVALEFHHLLSCISFYGKLSEELAGYGWKVQIQDISICNVNVAGTLTFADDPANGATLTPAASSVRQSIAMVMNNADEGAHLTLSTTAVEQDGEGNKIPLTSPSDIAMLMPQTLAAWNSDTETSGTTMPATSGGYLAINMRIFDSESHYHLGTASSYETVFVPFAINWSASNNYAYTLTFGLGLNAAGVSKKQPIGITCAITPWTTTSVTGTATH